MLGLPPSAAVRLVRPRDVSPCPSSKALAAKIATRVTSSAALGERREGERDERDDHGGDRQDEDPRRAPVSPTMRRWPRVDEPEDRSATALPTDGDG